MRARVRAGELVEPYRGIYARRKWWEACGLLEQRRVVLRTLSKLHPDWVFSHASAALMHGFLESSRMLRVVEVATTKSSHVPSSAQCRRRAMVGVRPVMVDGVHVTVLDRTIVDCARHYDFPEGLVMVDSALRCGAIDRQKLERTVREFRGWGKGRAARVLRYATGATDNGGESFAYGVMVEMGFVPPLVQQTIVDPLDPARKYRVDFLWSFPGGRVVVGELDGMVKYTDRQMMPEGDVRKALLREKIREERLRMAVSDVVRFSFVDVLDKKALWRKLRGAGIPFAGND